MELYLMEKLNWRLRVVNPFRFLRLLFFAFPPPQANHVTTDAEAFIDMSFGEYSFATNFAASDAAFAAAVLAIQQHTNDITSIEYIKHVNSYCKFDLIKMEACQKFYRSYYQILLKADINHEKQKDTTDNCSPNNVMDVEMPNSSKNNRSNIPCRVLQPKYVDRY